MQKIHMTPRRAEALKAIRVASEDGAQTVTEERWRCAFYAMTPACGENKKKSFRRSVDYLIESGVVQEVDHLEFALVKVPPTRTEARQDAGTFAGTSTGT